MKVAKKKDEHLSKIASKPSTSVATGKGGGIFSTIDSSFCLTRSQLEQPSSINATQVLTPLTTLRVGVTRMLIHELRLHWLYPLASSNNLVLP